MAHLTYNERVEWDAWRDAWRGVRTFPRAGEGRPTNAAKLMSEWRRQLPSAYADIKAGRQAKILRQPVPKWPTRTNWRQKTLPGVDRQRGKAMSKHAKFGRKPPKRPDADGCVTTIKSGKSHHLAPGNPYNICITRTQWKHLFPKAPLGKLPKELGRGGVFARAFARTRDTATKITNDATDARAYKVASENGVPGIPKLYGMYRLASKTDSQRPVYALVTERLRGTLDALKPLLDDALSCVRSRFDRLDRRELQDVCCAHVRGKKLCRKLAIQVPATLEALEALGIHARGDLHGNNLGLTKNNDWSILDLGLSGLPDTGKIAQSLQGAVQRRKHR